MQFCPNCGAQRTGAFRFCRICKFDFDTDTMPSAPESSAPSSPRPSDQTHEASPAAPVAAPVLGAIATGPVPNPGPRPTNRLRGAWDGLSRRGKIITAVVATLVVLAIIGSGSRPATPLTAGGSPGATATFLPTAGPTATPSVTVPPTPTPVPTPVPTPPPTPVPTPKPTPVTYNLLTSRDWQLLVKAPDNYIGKAYRIRACISQFDAATGTDSFRAQASYRSETYWYSDGDNSYFIGDATALAPFVTGDEIFVRVISLGSFSYDTQAGGNTTVPLFQVDTIERKGSC